MNNYFRRRFNETEQEPLFDLENTEMLIVLLRNQFEKVTTKNAELLYEINLLKGRVKELENICEHAILDRKIESGGD